MDESEKVMTSETLASSEKVMTSEDTPEKDMISGTLTSCEKAMTSVVTPVVKKRGRPRKSDVIKEHVKDVETEKYTDAAEKNTPHGIKTRKSAINVTSENGENKTYGNIITRECMEETPRSQLRGRPPRKSDLEEQTVNEQSKDGNTVQGDGENLKKETPSGKKRGRPKKSYTGNLDTTIVSDKIDVKAEEMNLTVTSSGKKRGRPRKQSVTDNLDTTDASDKIDDKAETEDRNLTVTSSGKKRGRPRKKSVTDNLDTTDISDKSDVETVTEEINLTVTSSGKKRGRPRKKSVTDNLDATDLSDKSDVETVTEEINLTVTSSGKKRGRPRKKSVTDNLDATDLSDKSDVETVTEEINLTVTSSGRKRRRPKRFITENGDTNDVSDMDEKSDKMDTTEVSDKTRTEEENDKQIEDVKPTVTPSGKKRGRPRKSDVGDNVTSPSDLILKRKTQEDKELRHGVTLSGKKRGRPRKSDISDQNIDISASENVDSTDHKKVPQRRKRCSTDTSEESFPGREKKSEMISPNVIKKRGRPPKSSEKNSMPSVKRRKLSGDNIKTHKIPKSRKSTQDYNTEEPESKSKGSWKCVLCAEEFTLPNLKYHMMTSHSAVWEKDCPEGKTDNKALKEIIKRLGKIICTKCGKEIKWIQYYRKHTEWCGREKELSECHICKRPIMTMWMDEHVRSHERQQGREEEIAAKKAQKDTTDETKEETNRGGVRRSAAKKARNLLQEIKEKGELVVHDAFDSDSDAKIHSSESEDDNVDDDDDDIDDDISDEENEDLKTTAPTVRRDPRILTNFSLDFDDTFKFYKKLYKENEILFTEHLPLKSDWIKQNTKEMLHYLPEIEESPDFIVKKKKNKTKMHSLKRFDSTAAYGSSFIFVGGPAWGLAWCPLPFTEQDPEQYIAISCGLDAEETTEINCSTSGKGLIQIWKVGTQDNNLKSCPRSKLEFSFAHDFGHVKSLKWCPSRCWQNPDLKTKEDSFLSRLGLLALACSDGTVRIYSVPHGKSLLSTPQNIDSSEVNLYKPHPVINLLPGGKGNTPCLCVAWQIQNDHQFILGSYGNGTVRIWNLVTTSPLLKSSAEFGTNILPFKTINVDGHAVTSCDWSIHSAGHFSTGGHGSEVKVWSLYEARYPFSQDRTQMANQMTWSYHTMGVIACTDDSFCHKHCYVRNNTFGLLNKEDVRAVGTGILSSHACHWTVACSDWIKLVFSADNKGRLMGVVLRDPYKEYLGKLRKRRLVVYDTEIKKKTLKAEDSEENKVKSNVNGSSTINRSGERIHVGNTSGINKYNDKSNHLLHNQNCSNDTVIENRKNGIQNDEHLINKGTANTLTVGKNDLVISDKNEWKDSGVDVVTSDKSILKESGVDLVTSDKTELKESGGDLVTTGHTELKDRDGVLVTSDKTELKERDGDIVISDNTELKESVSELATSDKTDSKESGGDLVTSNTNELKESVSELATSDKTDSKESGGDLDTSDKNELKESVSELATSDKTDSKESGGDLVISDKTDSKESGDLVTTDKTNSKESRGDLVTSDKTDLKERGDLVTSGIEIKGRGGDLVTLDNTLLKESGSDLLALDNTDIKDNLVISDNTELKKGVGGVVTSSDAKIKKNGSDLFMNDNCERRHIQTYKESVKYHYLEYTDYMENNVKVCDVEDQVDRFPLAAIYRIALNPNPQGCTILASGGASGIIRFHNVYDLLSIQTREELKTGLSNIKKTKSENYDLNTESQEENKI